MNQAEHRVPALLVALAGGLSLAAAMGVGRFAFTPVLPLMLREGRLDVAQGSWVAAANYAGYLAGALSAARLPLRAGTLAVLALLATVLLTAAMAWPLAAAWAPLRFVAGAASAWAFVATSVWCLGALARQGASHAAGGVYAGVGSGIALAGLHGLLAGAAGVSSPVLWLQLGVLALLLTLPVFWVIHRLPATAAPAATAASVGGSYPSGTAGVVACYGIMGFGYILPATFLPVLARSVVDDPRVFGLAWPVFGTTAALSTLLAARWLNRATRLKAWAACQALMGLGVLLPALRVEGWTIAASALLVGGTFMVVTLAGVQEMRERAGADAVRLLGRGTTAFALGQIAGPAASATLLHVGPQGLAWALAAGAVALLGSAAYLWQAARRPMPG